MRHSCHSPIALDDDAAGMAVVRDTWDDEEDVKDDWDAEEEPAKPIVAAPAKPRPSTTSTPTTSTTKPSAAKTTTAPNNETEQEKKARLERLVQERDLDHALSLFGLSSDAHKNGPPPASNPVPAASVSPFDTLNPSSIPEFDQFTRIITKRLEAFEVLPPPVGHSCHAAGFRITSIIRSSSRDSSTRS